jgi:MFS family permease
VSLQTTANRPSLERIWQDLSSPVKRNLMFLFVAQALSTSATTVSTTLSSIIIFNITASEGLSGLPSTINFFMSAITAYWAGRLMQLKGRRFGLTLGYGVGVLGAILAATMALEKNLLGFLIGGALVGASNGAIQQAKYAAGEMVSSAVRGTVIGALVTGSAFGSLLSWAVAPLIHSLAKAQGLPSIEFGWYLGAFWLLLGALVLGFGLRPDPSTLAVQETRVVSSGAVRTWGVLLKIPEMRLALVSMGLGQMVMVGLMVLMPLHAKHMGHEESATGLISVHVLGMFAFGWLTGHLVDIWGRKTMIQLGAVLLMLSGFIAVFATRPLEMGFSLFVLGLGWNFCSVAGTTLLTDQLKAHERATIQGGAELVVWLAAATGALGGGLIVGAFGFSTIGWVALGVGALPMVATWVFGQQK